MEEFKDVQGFEGLYKIGNLGTVLNKHNKQIYGSPNHEGYIQVCLFKDKKKNRFALHRLVGFHFIENVDKRNQINHINGVKSDNRAINLEWCTAKKNSNHAIITGLRKSYIGENNPLSRLTKNQILEIRKLYKTGEYSYKSLSKLFPVKERTIAAIIRKEIWKHI